MRKNNQTGRSMVEMLGVLAIIGVLSVGGIAGYSKAMFKYKMNKTMDIVSHVITRLSQLDTINLGNDFNLYNQQEAIKYDVMPDCDVDYIDSMNSHSYCPMPLGEIGFSFEFNSERSLFGTLYLRFFQEPFEGCLTFFNSGIYKNVPENWWHPYGLISFNGISNLVYAKSDEFIKDGAKSELTSQDILDACEICKNQNFCEIEWSIKAYL